METVIVKIDTPARAKALVKYFQTLIGVKAVELNTSKKSLTDADWVRPGRPATKEELEQLADDMDADKGAYTPEEVLNFVNEELAKYRKKK
ncbi:MAG: hypothetical protein K0B10_01420 [Vicingaceae bacterium]|nr:hypothetical protein [Vicingaceae bacterium]